MKTARLLTGALHRGLVSQRIEPFQFPRNFVDAFLQVTSRTLLGIDRGMPPARIRIDGDTHFRLGELAADHLCKLNGAFLYLGHYPVQYGLT